MHSYYYDVCLSDVWLSDVCLSVAYIGPKSRTERPRKTKIGTEVALVARDSDTTFKVKRSKVNLLCPAPRAGGIKRWCASGVCLTSDVCLSVTNIGPKLRIERLRKTKIGTEVAHIPPWLVTRTPLSRSIGQMSPCRGRRHIVPASRTACYNGRPAWWALPIFW